MTEVQQKPLGSGSATPRYVLTALASLVVLVITYILGNEGVLVPVRWFLPLHLVLEFSSIVVSFAVFTTGWFGYRQTGSLRDLVIGLTFLAAGSADFVHTLSYKGMPDFLGDNHPGRAAAYWLLGRIVVGAGLLAAAHVSHLARDHRLTPRRLIAATLVVTSALIVFISVHSSIGELLFRERGGLTAPKLALEALAIVLYAAIFVSLTPSRGWSPDTAYILRQGMLFAILAEAAFSLYASPVSPMNALGHVFKTVAYYLVLNALFVSALQRPYEQLAGARDELQKLYADAQDHRQEIEQSFTRIGSALSSSLDIDSALTRIAELASDMLHADCSTVVLLGHKYGSQRVAAQRGGCHDVHRPTELALRVGQEAIAQKQGIVVNDLQTTGWVICDFTHANCLRSMVCAPMVFEDQALGIVSIYSYTANAFEEGDVNLLQAFASHAAVAVHNAISYQRESNIANVLQRSIVSPASLKIERFEIAQVYQPAMDEALIGGDFYDVIEMDNDRVALVIGDVSGKGLSAAVFTAMVKYTLRAYLGEGHVPAEAMSLLNAEVARVANYDSFITLFLGVLDTHTGELRYINAGHEPPVYALNGTFSTLPSTGPALGLGVDLGYEERSIELASDSLLLLYTDGISEARTSEGAMMGTEGIGETLMACHAMSSSDVAQYVHTSATEFAEGVLRDDAAILAVHALGENPASLTSPAAEQ